MTQVSNLEISYQELFTQLDKNKIEEETRKLIEQKDFLTKDNWLKGLVLCDLALANNKITEEIKKLYIQLYRKNSNLYFSTGLEASDYKFWFKKTEEINDKFLNQKFTRAYAERDYMLETARRPFRNREKEREYLLTGIELEDPVCMAIYGYNLYFAMRGEKEDKKEGLKWMGKSKELGYENADNYFLNLTYYTEADNTKILAAIEEYNNSKKEESEKSYHLLGEFYIYKEENLEKAKEVLIEGIKNNNPYCHYILGINILNERFSGYDKEEGIKLLEEAYKYGVIYAANWLGRYYYTQDSNKSIQKSIEWHEKAKLYYFEDSLVELALTYLYDESVKDGEKGHIYLDWAIQEESPRAMSEKAHLLLNQEVPDIVEARKLLEKATELGDSYSPYRLGLLYERGDFNGEPDYYKAFELYQLSAERGHIYGIELVGHYYRIGVTKAEEADPEKAIEYFNQAIERGSDYAKVELAFCYEAGLGVDQDYQKAYDLFKTAAENGFIYAYNKIGYYEEHGLLGEKNFENAFQAYQKAAEGGNVEGMYNLGRSYKYAIGVPENPELAIENYNKAIEYNYGDAFIEMALAYENEYGGLEFDAQKAQDYMLKAAEQGYSFAQYKVGYYYYYGFIEKDFEKALYWLYKSYVGGYPYAAIVLGDYYLYNDGGQEDPEYNKAFEYYKTAEQQGVVSEGLGVCYEYGIGTEENPHEAFKYYKAGAEIGYTSAKYRLGTAYKYGTGTKKNQEEAYRWLSEAAREGNIRAEYLSAMMLLEGEGVTPDEEQAIIQLTKVAEAEYADAQFELGNCYLIGKGVSEDEVKAMVWYQKAAENGNEQAQKITGKRQRKRR